MTIDMGLTVRELIELLEERVEEGLGNATVILSSDEEGNSFHPLSAWSKGRGEGSYHVEYMDTEGEDYDDEDGDYFVVVLWP